MRSLPSHPWGPGSRVGWQPYSKLMVGRRPLAGLGEVTDYWPDEVARGIFSGKGGRFYGAGAGIFGKDWAIPTAIFTEPMYAGANVIDPSAEFREHGLYDYREKPPGASLRHVAPAGLEWTGVSPLTKWTLLALAGYLAWKTWGKLVRHNPIPSAARRKRLGEYVLEERQPDGSWKLYTAQAFSKSEAKRYARQLGPKVRAKALWR